MLVADETTLRSRWPLARVIEVMPGIDGFVQRFKVKIKLQFWSDQSLSACFWKLLKRMNIKNIYHFHILYLNFA